MAWVRAIQHVDQLQRQTDDQGLVGWLTDEQGRFPVFRLTTLLHQPDAAGQRRGKILVLKTPSQSWGLLVDRVESVIHVTTRTLFPLPTIARNLAMDVFEGVVKYEEQMMLALSPEGLYPDAAIRVLSTLPTEHSLDMLYTVADMAIASDSRKKIVVFTTTAEPSLTFGLSLSQVPQILCPLPLLAVPGAPASILGLVEWRGVPLPVIDLSRSLGGAASSANGRLLVVRASTSRLCVGLPIHPQVSIHDLPMAHHVSSQPVPLQEALLRGKFVLPHTTLVIPDIDGILNSYHSCPA
jgi:chemotaxis signal transduction protein